MALTNAASKANMMAGDSPTLKPGIGFELQETRITAAITKARNVTDKGVQFEPLDVSDETDFIPKAPSVQADSEVNKHKLCNSSQNNNEEDIIVDERLPERETKLNLEKDTDLAAADMPEKPEDEPNCVVNFLYCVDQCCECTIL